MDSLLNTISSTLIIYIFIGFIIFTYLLLSLLNWSFVKPLKFMGISSIIVGAIVSSLRLFSGLLTGLIKDIIPLPEIILIGVLKPVLIIGITEIVLGILLLALGIKFDKKIIKQQKKLTVNSF